MLTLIQGPAGGGKSRSWPPRILASGEAQLLSDVTALWAALAGGTPRA